LIEIADEVQLMRLNPTIQNIIESNNIVSRSGLFSQHQGLDAVLEEINKTLKTLIPPVPQMHHWKIAARNCKKFLQVSSYFVQYKYVDMLTFGYIYLQSSCGTIFSKQSDIMTFKQLAQETDQTS